MKMKLKNTFGPFSVPSLPSYLKCLLLKAQAAVKISSWFSGHHCARQVLTLNQFTTVVTAFGVVTKPLNPR